METLLLEKYGLIKQPDVPKDTGGHSDRAQTKFTGRHLPRYFRNSTILASRGSSQPHTLPGSHDTPSQDHVTPPSQDHVTLSAAADVPAAPRPADASKSQHHLQGARRSGVGFRRGHREKINGVLKQLTV